MMEPDDVDELRALVVGFLQQSIKDNPNGFALEQFERIFPDRCDEPRDWYKRYGKSNALDALKCIVGDSISVRPSRGTYQISLIVSGSGVDKDLLSLIVGQKTSSKKSSRGRGRYQSFVALNQIRSHRTTPSQFRPRRNSPDNSCYYNDRRPSSASIGPPRPQPTSYNSMSQNRSGPYSSDPRRLSQLQSSSLMTSEARSQSVIGSQNIQPQVTSRSPSTSTTSPSNITSLKWQSPSTTVSPQQQSISTKQSTNDSQVLRTINLVNQNFQEPSSTPKNVTRIDSNPEVERKKDILAQRISRLMSTRTNDLKLLHLSSLYKLEFEEEIKAQDYGYNSLTELLRDPVLTKQFEINCHAPFFSLRRRLPGSETSCQEEAISSNLSKVTVADPFNLKKMISSLQKTTWTLS